MPTPRLPTHPFFTFLPPQFVDAGCENCTYLAMQGDAGRVQDCTTVEFSGVAAVVDPAASWVGSWLGVERAVPGVYAVAVRADRLSEEVEELLAERGIDWRARVDAG